MSQQQRNTFGLVILVVVILCAFFWLNPWFRYSCSRIFVHDFLGMDHGMLTHGLFLTDRGVARVLPLMAMLVLWSVVALWVYFDAERRNHSGLLWALLVFVGNVIGLLIYLIVRSTGTGTPAKAISCPSCSKPIESEYVACPHCGAGLAKKCAQCGKRAEYDWKVCPYCGQAIE